MYLCNISNSVCVIVVDHYNSESIEGMKGVWTILNPLPILLLLFSIIKGVSYEP